MGFFYNDLIDDEKNFIDKEFTSLWYRVWFFSSLY